MTRRASRQAGFLMADTLVTLTVSAFVLVGLTGLSSVLLRTADRSVARMQTADDLGRTVTSLAHLLESAARARFAGAEPQPFIFNGDGQRLMFAWRDMAPGSGRRLQVLAFRSETDGTLLKAEASLPVLAAGPADLTFGPPRTAYGGPSRLRFAYLDAANTGTRPAWLASWPIGMHMPTAVAIEVVDASGQRLLRRLEVPLVADTDLGCLVGGFCGRTLPPETDAADVPAAAPAGASQSPKVGQ